MYHDITTFISPTLGGTHNTSNTTRPILSPFHTNDPSSETRREDIIYMCVVLFGLLTSSACLAIRIASIRERNTFYQLTITHWIVLVTYLLGSIFCVGSCLLYFGHTIYDHSSCFAAICLALVFYYFQKYLLFFFLVERAHSVRARTKTRMEDMMYLIGLAMLAVGFVGLGGAAWVSYIADFDEETGVCKIGLALPVASALLGWDIFLNIYLTVVFFHFCQQFMIQGTAKSIFPKAMLRFSDRVVLYVKNNTEASPENHEDVNFQQTALLRVVRKAIFACFLVLVGTVANLSILLYYSGREKAWMFFTYATLDATWAVLIIHWLTNTPGEMGSRQQSSINSSRMREAQANPQQPQSVPDNVLRD